MTGSVSNDNSSNLVVRELDILLIHGQDKWGIKLGDRWELEVAQKRELWTILVPDL